MRSFYYYVPPCPDCGSAATGRYVNPPLINKDYMIIESLQNGEIIRYKSKLKENRCFCTDCGFEWEESPRVVRITDEEKNGERKRRHTEKLLNEYYKEYGINSNRRKNFKGFFSGIINF